MGISEIMAVMKRAVFLDRDGVLNRTYVHEDGKTHPPASPEEMEVLPGVIEACQALRQAGFLLIVVSNQPDVARGTQSRSVVEAINDELSRHVTVDEIRVCYHDSQDHCACRKPKPGLLLEAAGAWGIDIMRSFIVGDRATDIEAGQKAGCKAVLINAAPLEAEGCRPDFQAASWREAVEWILSLDRQAYPFSQ
jgi:D-glycero-D-manno-heptose 1,7-bisphosphate phosphatase